MLHRRMRQSEGIAQDWQSAPPLNTVPLSADTTTEEALTTYLTETRRSLTVLSEPEKQAVLDEMRQHLLASAKAYEELGDTPTVALQNALAAFGASENLGRSLSNTYQTTGTARTLPPWASLRRALRVFALANMMTMSVLLFITYLMVYQGAFRGGVDHFVPFLLVVIPALAGGRIGASTNAPRAGFGAFLALSLLALVTSPLMLLMLHLSPDRLPFTDLLVVLPMLFIAWMPVGCLAATITNSVVQRRAKQLRLV